MKSNKIIAITFFTALGIALLFISCKKKKAFKQENGQSSVEIRNAQAECAILIKDINEVMSGQLLLRGKSATATGGLYGTICGLVTDTTQVAQGIVRLTYDGSICNGRRRAGMITLTLADYPAIKVKSVNSSIRIDFTAYRVTKTAFGSSLQFDGTAYLKNESGGSWFDLLFLNQPALVQSITADNLLATVNDNAAVYYSISRRMTYTCANKTVTCMEEGTGSHNGKNNVENWGYTSLKKEFTSRIVTPVKWSTICGPAYPLGGEVVIKEEDKAFELNCRYGTDSEGNTAALSAADCAYGWKLDWSYKKNTRSRVFSYDN